VTKDEIVIVGELAFVGNRGRGRPDGCRFPEILAKKKGT